MQGLHQDHACCAGFDNLSLIIVPTGITQRNLGGRPVASYCRPLLLFDLLILLDQPILLREVHTTTRRHSRCYYHASTHRGNQPLITDRLWALEVIKIVPGTWRELPFVTLRQVHQTRSDFLTNGYGYSNIGHGICRSEEWRTHKRN